MPVYEGSSSQIRKQSEQVKAIAYLMRNDAAVANLDAILWKELNKLAQLCSTVSVSKKAAGRL